MLPRALRPLATDSTCRTQSVVTSMLTFLHNIAFEELTLRTRLYRLESE